MTDQFSEYAAYQAGTSAPGSARWYVDRVVARQKDQSRRVAEFLLRDRVLPDEAADTLLRLREAIPPLDGMLALLPLRPARAVLTGVETVPLSFSPQSIIFETDFPELLLDATVGPASPILMTLSRPSLSAGVSPGFANDITGLLTDVTLAQAISVQEETIAVTIEDLLSPDLAVFELGTVSSPLPTVIYRSRIDVPKSRWTRSLDAARMIGSYGITGMATFGTTLALSYAGVPAAAFVSPLLLYTGLRTGGIAYDIVSGRARNLLTDTGLLTSQRDTNLPRLEFRDVDDARRLQVFHSARSCH
jgi:hypothetical protein